MHASRRVSVLLSVCTAGYILGFLVPSLLRNGASYLDAHPSQAAGHGNLKRLEGEKDVILKPIMGRELKTYLLFNKTLRGFLEYVPPFKGTREVSGREFIAMSDLTAGMRQPCILDLKLGNKEYVRQETPAALKSYLLHKIESTTMAQLGFRLGGARVHSAPLTDPLPGWNVADGVHVFNRRKSHILDIAETLQGIALYFFGGGGTLRVDVAKSFIARLRQYAEFLKKSQHGLLFFGSSILCLYDAQQQASARTPQLHHIDFAHTFPASLVVLSEDGAAVRAPKDEQGLEQTAASGDGSRRQQHAGTAGGDADGVLLGITTLATCLEVTLVCAQRNSSVEAVLACVDRNAARFA